MKNNLFVAKAIFVIYLVFAVGLSFSQEDNSNDSLTNDLSSNEILLDNSVIHDRSICINQSIEGFQINDSKYKSKRKPVLSCIYSVLYAGIGQFYNKEPYKGLTFMLCYTSAVVGFLTAPYDYWEYTNAYGVTTGYYDLSTSQYIYMISSGLILILSAIDAPISSSKINKENGFTSSNIFENRNIGLNLSPHSEFAFANAKKTPTIGLKLSLKIK